MNSLHDIDRVAVVASRWHAAIVDRAVDSFAAEVSARTSVQVERIHVPGAFEIPLQVQRLARTGAYAAIAGCALVIDGGIYRHDFVADAVVSGLMHVQLTTDVPVFSAVLSPHHFHEHDVHAAFFAEHMAAKGVELADAVLGATMLGRKASR